MLLNEAQITWQKLFAEPIERETKIFLVAIPDLAADTQAVLEEKINCPVIIVDPYAVIECPDKSKRDAPICLAQGLARIPHIIVHPEKVQTNIVNYEFTPVVSGADFLQKLAAGGVKFLHHGGQRVRAVTNRMVSAEDVDEALQRVERLMNKLS